MNKSTALELLGGSIKAAAEACQISSSAVSQWPDELTKDQTDRVQAALYRKQQPSAPEPQPPGPDRRQPSDHPMQETYSGQDVAAQVPGEAVAPVQRVA